MSAFRRGECTCVHVPKHHKRSGRCRGNCKCRAAARKDERKRK